MVYCTKCGTNNADDATVCVNCSASLYGTTTKSKAQWGHKQYKDAYYGFHRRNRALVAFIIGIVIVLIGASNLLNEIYNIHIPWWEIILILLGAWLIIRAVMAMKRRR